GLVDDPSPLSELFIAANNTTYKQGDDFLNSDGQFQIHAQHTKLSQKGASTSGCGRFSSTPY
ncbi:MAG: hypothetical protein OEZ28_04860, partial [Nitrospinota bacterium]|nr:hypothetical protein [Nitrospinota bacterium]